MVFFRRMGRKAGNDSHVLHLEFLGLLLSYLEKADRPLLSLPFMNWNVKASMGSWPKGFSTDPPSNYGLFAELPLQLCTSLREVRRRGGEG
jgi:hypothetical protein